MWRRIILSASVLCLLAMSQFAQLVAQELVEYRAWKLDNTFESQLTDVTNALKSGNVGDRERFNRFLEEYYFSRWTDPKEAMRLSSYSQDFSRSFLSGATGQARDVLLSQSLMLLSRMADDQTIYPAARINAMLAIGKLVETPGAGGERDKLYPAAIPFLIQKSQDKASPDWLRCSALLGVVRNAQIGIVDDTTRKETVPKLFISILDEVAPVTLLPEERAKIDWFRLRALEGFQGLRATGNRGESLAAVLKVLENLDEKPELRYTAAKVLGDLQLKEAIDSGVEIDSRKIAESLLRFTEGMCTGEIAFMDAMLIDAAAAGQSGGGRGAGGMGGGGMGGGGGGRSAGATGNSEQIELMISRVKMASCSILNGLGGQKASKISPFTDSTGIVDVIPKGEEDEKLQKRVKNAIKYLEALLIFLDDGPKETTRGSSGGRDTPPSSASGGRSDDSRQQSTPNVTLDDIRAGLEELAKKLNTPI